MTARLVPWTACALALAFAAPAGAEPRLIDDAALRFEPALAAASAPPMLALAAAAEPAAPAAAPGLDFDLLGVAAAPPPTDAGRMNTRRVMLKTHQALGLGLVAAQLGSTVAGQLNYSDKFSSGDNTNRYRELHSVAAWTNIGLFAVTGGVALFAPSPRGKTDAGFDRVKRHKLAMIAATAGMLAQGALGLYTASREGYENQQSTAQIHLALGYATTAALLLGVGALVF
jgi:hypothetical protein